jgi:hypothetical protein
MVAKVPNSLFGLLLQLVDDAVNSNVAIGCCSIMLVGHS